MTNDYIRFHHHRTQLQQSNAETPQSVIAPGSSRSFFLSCVLSQHASGPGRSPRWHPMARPVALLALLLGLAICGSAFAAYEKEKKFWVWPKPVNSSIGDASAWLDESNFVIKLAPGSFEHDILTSACSRFAKSIAQNHGVRLSDLSYFMFLPSLAILPTFILTYSILFHVLRSFLDSNRRWSSLTIRNYLRSRQPLRPRKSKSLPSMCSLPPRPWTLALMNHTACQ